MRFGSLVAAAFSATALIAAAPALAQRSEAPVPPGVSTDPWPGVMQLEVDASDVQRAIYSVRQTIPVRGGGSLRLRYPQWLPGKHAPRGAIAEIAGLTFAANGRVLTWRRDPRDVFSFTVDVPDGVRSVEARFQFLSPTRTSEGRVVMTPALLNLQWEQVSLYPAGTAVRAIRVQPSVILPQGWTAATALDGAQVQGNRIRYDATDYETLVDSPIFAGQYFRRWDLGNAVTLNVVADEPGSLEATAEQIAAHRAMVDEAVALFGVRHFDRYQFLLALTDKLGGIGLEHHRSTEISRDTDYFTDWANNAGARGTLPHELVHSWNGKFRRPLGLATPDYAMPMDPRLLWVYEGQTSYWDLVLGARSGLQPLDIVLGEWARYAATYQAMPGRAWRSVEDTTFDPIIAARKPRAFPSETRTEDYYNESSLIWMEADMLIRTRSHGTKSLDDFARAFFGGRDGDWGTSSYRFEDVVAALNAVLPYDWAGFFQSRIMQPGQPAPLTGLEMGGYRLVFRNTPNAYDAERAKETRALDLTFSLGVTIGKDGEVSAVQYDGPMFAEGVTNGTRILAVGGMAYSEDRMRAAIRTATDRRTPITLLVEKDGRYRTITPAWTQGLRYPWLERTGTGPALLDRVLMPLRTTQSSS
jgi:predicted metalloprotease with PDZ domain